jgi:hypothetical protein
MEILRLDDPQSVDESYPEVSPFETDEDAEQFVTYSAAAGSKYHKQAVKLSSRSKKKKV